jgi:creatinine amidohydrolase/Fe(II)-dependent formamide hydrolase-like protein
MGTDVIIAEGFAERIADEVGGVVFPPIWMGADAWRTEEQKKRWGLPVEFNFFGMNMDSLPLRSEYHDLSLIREVLTNRVRYARDCGFRLCVVVNWHGGEGQFELCEELAETLTEPGNFDVRALFPTQHTGPDQGLGGHASQPETRAVLGLRPELVRLENLPEGTLDVWEHGILHFGRQIPPEENPRHTSYVEARETANTVVANCAAVVRGWLAEAGVVARPPGKK